MLSPENFYSVFCNRYSFPKTPNIILTPKNFGSKAITDFGTYATADIGSYFNGMKSHADLCDFGRIIMHDQEPIIKEFADTYKTILVNGKKDLYEESGLELADLVSGWCASTSIPIICHSEVNSDEVAHLQEHKFLDCYYWYHGLIAQDWFRHWLWHDDLTVKNRGMTSCRFLLYARGRDGTRHYRNELIQRLSPLKETVRFDWEDNSPVASDYSAKIDVDDSNMSAVHIVAETLFHTNKTHLTEKIFKPMVMSQPFVIFGPPNSLAYLKRYGFQTFDCVWNEEYDTEVDAQRRMDKALDLIYSIASMTRMEFIELYEKILPILDHNRRWFYSDDFRNMLLDELESNMSSALEQQREMLEQNPGGQYAFTVNHLKQTGKYLPPSYEYRMKLYLQKVASKKLQQDIIARYPALGYMVS